MSNFRSRALLDLCYQFDCLLQIPLVCDGGRGEPCHSNQQIIQGKGMSIKADDCFVVPGCRRCHMALDSGSKLSREEKQDLWNRAYFNYQRILWKEGCIGLVT